MRRINTEEEKNILKKRKGSPEEKKNKAIATFNFI